MEYWINTYGYAAVFIGCFFEGETILVLGAFAAHRGYLSLAGVCFAAFMGTFLGDQLYYDPWQCMVPPRPGRTTKVHCQGSLKYSL